ncbi:MAG: hypothetical protein GXY87_01455 [Tissierellia bacterium]|nr:hypothetical protein [Tissierellia bacterium]
MKVITSRNHRNIQNYIYSRIKEDLETHKNVYYVVPEQFTLGTELDVFKSLKLESMIDLKIKSFRSIINEVLSFCGGANNNYLSEFSQKFIVKLAINDVRDNLKVYQKSVNEEGFIDLILEFFKIIKSNMYDSKAFNEVVEKNNENNLLHDKLSDISIIFTQYESILKGSKYDSNDRTDIAISKIAQMEKFKNTVFYFDQFNNMSIQEIELLKQIDDIALDAYIGITIDSNMITTKSDDNIYDFEVDDASVFEVSRRFINSLYRVNPSFIHLEKNNHPNENIDKLLKKIFSYKTPTKDDLDNIYVNRYKNTKEESEALAININKDIFENKFRYKDIAVVVSNSVEYFKFLKREFKVNDIPHFIDDHRNLLENPIAKYIKSAINLVNSSFSSVDIITYIKHSFFDIDENKINIFQNYLTQRQIKGDMIFNDRYFTFTEEGEVSRVRDKYQEEDRINLEIVNEVRSIFLKAIDAFGHSVNDINEYRIKMNSIANYCKSIYEFISAPQSIERIEKYEQWLINNERNDIIDENRLVWNEFVSILNDFYSIDEDYELDFSKFSQYLNEAVSEIKIGIVPPSQDQVIVGDFNRSRLQEIKKIYIVGLTNMYFPKAHNEPDIFLESEKQSLIDSGMDIDNTHKNKNQKDLLALYNNLSKATDEIVFSYSLINSSNEAMQEASIIEFIEQMLDDNNINIQGIDYRDNIFSKSRLSYYLPTSFRKMKNRKHIDEDEKTFVRSVLDNIENIEKIENKENYREILSSIYNTDRMLIKNRHISKDAIDSIYTETKRFSVSELEQYIKCPYQHFITYGVKPRISRQFNVDSMDYGNITHKSLDSFVKNSKKDEVQDIHTKDEMSVITQEIFDENVNFYVEDYQIADAKNQYFLSKLKNMIDVSLVVVNNQMKVIEPDNILTEAVYGVRGQFPPLSYEIDGVKYNMQGIIDRVDQYVIDGKNYFRIIDYKTGNKVFNLGKVYHGLDLQLMVYLYTVISRDNNSEPLGAFYQVLNHRFTDIGHNPQQDEFIEERHRLNGIIVDDLKALSISDKSFVKRAAQNSEVINFQGRAHDYNAKNNVVDKFLINKLMDRVNEKIVSSIKNIKGGNIAVKPYKLDKETPCQYCQYRAICKFEYNDYNRLEKLTADDVKEILGGNDGEY